MACLTPPHLRHQRVEKRVVDEINRGVRSGGMRGGDGREEGRKKEGRRVEERERRVEERARRVEEGMGGLEVA